MSDAAAVTEMRLVVTARDAGHLRVAFGVPDAAAATSKLVEAGADLVAEPTETPWGSLNSRLEAPADLQLTLFGPGPALAEQPR